MIEITLDSGKVVTAHINGHEIKTDQPENSGGQNSAPTPFDLFLASIGTCAGIYIKNFCDNRGIDTSKIKIIQEIKFDASNGLPSEIILDIKLPDDFPEKYRDAVINSAELCKVKKTIANNLTFNVITS
jgi:putative redox protein